MASIITDCPTEYAIWQQEQERDSELYDEYCQQMVESAEQDLNGLLMLIDRIPKYAEHIENDTLNDALTHEKMIAQEYLTTVREILNGNQENVFLHSILQPISSALMECEFNLEAVDRVLGQKGDNPTDDSDNEGES